MPKVQSRSVSRFKSKGLGQNDYFFKRFVLCATFVAGDDIFNVGRITGAEFDCSGWELESLFTD